MIWKKGLMLLVPLLNKSFWEQVFGQFVRWDSDLERLKHKWNPSQEEKMQSGAAG